MTATPPDAAADQADEWDIGQLDLSAYLRRIGYQADLAPTVQTLAGLHRAHVATIPFENADIPLGRGVAVDLPSIQRKLVGHRRGGYCFEHGSLLAAVLERLGYRVGRLLARVGGEHSERTHLVLRVRVGERHWLADTGFGTGLIEPIPFDGEAHAQYGWTYRLLADGGHAWRLQEQRDGGWTTLYWFDDVPQYPADVRVANHFTSAYPDSAFVRHLVAARKDTTGLRRLTDRRLTITRPGHPDDERQLGDAEFAGILTGLFGLELTGEDTGLLTAFTSVPR